MSRVYLTRKIVHTRFLQSVGWHWMVMVEALHCPIPAYNNSARVGETGQEKFLGLNLKKLFLILFRSQNYITSSRLWIYVNYI